MGKPNRDRLCLKEFSSQLYQCLFNLQQRRRATSCGPLFTHQVPVPLDLHQNASVAVGKGRPVEHALPAVDNLHEEVTISLGTPNRLQYIKAGCSCFEHNCGFAGRGEKSKDGIHQQDTSVESPFFMRSSESEHRALESKHSLPTTSSQQSLSLEACLKTTKRDPSSAICLMPNLEACRLHCECRSVHAIS